MNVILKRKVKLYLPVYLLLAIISEKTLIKQFELLFAFTFCFALDVWLTNKLFEMNRADNK